MAPAKAQLLTIAIYSWRTRATPAARAMAKDSECEPQEETLIDQEDTLIESPSRHDAAHRVEPVALGGPAAGRKGWLELLSRRQR